MEEEEEGGEYLVVVAEPVVAYVGDDDTGFFRLDGGIWEILRWWDVRRIFSFFLAW